MNDRTMPRLTVTITDEQDELLEDLTGDGGEYESKSEAVRELIRRGEEAEELRAEVERLENRNRMIIEQREEHQELVEYVESEKSLQERREQREREREQAGILTRGKWWVFGRPAPDESEAAEEG